jgi:hypothetical protein
MWDIAGGGMRMLSLFWRAMKAVRPDTEGELARVGTSEGEIAERLEGAGFRDVAGGALEVSVDYAGFDDFWEPFTFAVGPSGQALAKLDGKDRDAVREAVRAELPDGPFSLDARAWYATASVR